MIDISQFRTLVVRPVLEKLAEWNPTFYSPAAENLLVGTAIQESHLTYLKQLGGGPALGVMQIEPNTHDDVWRNYLEFRQDLANVVSTFSALDEDRASQLPWNMAYSVAIARLIYYRQPTAMPSDANDLEALAQYWKAHYNTVGGAGTPQEWVENYQQFVSA